MRLKNNIPEVFDGIQIWDQELIIFSFIEDCKMAALFMKQV